MHQRAALAAVILAWCCHAHAQEWFTVLGDLNRPQVDTAQIDAQSIQKARPGQNLLFRVTLADSRKLGDEVYQSYTSIISVECDTHAITHQFQVRYAGPLWAGAKTSETFTQPKPMAFGGLPVELRQRVLAAACARKQARP